MPSGSKVSHLNEMLAIDFQTVVRPRMWKIATISPPSLSACDGVSGGDANWTPGW